jgi:hypothetical protein
MHKIKARSRAGVCEHASAAHLISAGPRDPTETGHITEPIGRLSQLPRARHDRGLTVSRSSRESFADQHANVGERKR